jgi:hypothetical protein
MHVPHNRDVTSPLSGIPVEKRRHLAATLGLFAMLFVAIGAVAATGATTAVVKAFVVIALVVAALLGLMAWGVLHSVRLDVAERRLEDAIAEAVAAQGGSLCSCGHEHDPTELHFTDAACAHDGTGTDCTRSCDSCVLAAARPVATARSRESAGVRSDAAAPGPAAALRSEAAALEPGAAARRPSPAPRRPSPVRR